MQLTKITTTKPPTLSKSFRLTDTGDLQKLSGGPLVEGIAERIQIHDVSELAELLNSLNPANALIYGVTPHERARVVTKKALNRMTDNGGPPTIARTREHFKYSDGPGILMLDNDPGKGQAPLTGDQFRKALYTVCPAIETAPHILTPSASSYIYKGNECLKGPGGWRVLVVVKRAQYIERAGDVLFKSSWLSDMGYIFISKSGAMLPRSIIDASVWQPERLDFCGGAHCVKPLEQRRPAPEIFNSEAEPLDTIKELKDLSHAQEAAFIHAKGAVIKAARSDANEIQEQWIAARVKEIVAEKPEEEKEVASQSARALLTMAAKKRILLGDFILTLPNGQTVTVGELLDSPDKWHGKRCADPLEPNYNNDRDICYINLRAGGRPYLWSFAHGGQRYNLHRARETIQLIDGERYDTVNKILELIRINGAHYDRGEIVTVSQDGEVIPRDKDGLLYDFDGLVRFQRYDRRSEEWRGCDCKPTIAAGVLAAQGAWNLPKLTGISTAPLIDPASGRLIDTDGYDPQTGLILILNDISKWQGLPETSDVGALAGILEDAVQRLWTPFSEFPFDGPVSQGVWLNAILTGATRPLLPTAPGVAVTSPVPGSGKTFLAKCVATLIGEIPALLPDAGDSEEVRKRLLALLRQGKRILILDNVVGVLDSSALCVMLTGDTFEDRVLGASETISVPTRTMVIITGNNVIFRGDLCRRVLTSRIDPEMETPWKRAFDLDPVHYCKTHRLEMIRDALTIIRIGLKIGPKMPDRTASFELWSDSIRRAVCLVGKYGFLDVADPVKSIDTAYEMDPETAKLSALTAAWWQIWKDKPIKVADLITQASDALVDAYLYPELRSALREIAGEGYSINSRRLGRWIERNRERIQGGKRIVAAGRKDGVRQWSIKKVV